MLRVMEHRRALLVLALGGLTLLGVLAYVEPGRAPPPAVPPAAAQPAPVPVTVAPVARRDVPLTVSGIGNVAPFQSVTVRTRVDGQLQTLSFAEGQDVRAGDPLAQLDPRPCEATLRQMVAALHLDEARLASAQADLARFSELAKNSFASRQSVDTQQALVAQVQAAIESDHAQIDNATVQLHYTTITAPIGGRVGFRLVDVGSIVHASDPTGLVVISQLTPVAVMFTLPADSLGAVNRLLIAGAHPEVTALPRDGGAPATGRLDTIDNAIDQRTGTFRLKAIFPNADRALWPGQFVTARLLLGTRRDGIVVPAEAVQHGPDGSFAFVVDPAGTAVLRPLAVDRIEDGIALIDSGLAPGEQVVVDGQFRLRPGVRVSAAPMPPA